MDADGHPHQHLLGSLHHLASDLEQIGALQGLEPKVLVLKVANVNDSRVKTIFVVLDDFVVLVRDHWNLLASLGAFHIVRSATTSLNFFLVSLCRLETANLAARIA